MGDPVFSLLKLFHDFICMNVVLLQGPGGFMSMLTVTGVKVVRDVRGSIYTENRTKLSGKQR